jgi:hypothetical protein
MSSNPINLAARFLLEIFSLAVIGIWGWKQGDNWERYILAIGLPVIAAAIWGTFAVAKDPSRSGNAPVPISGIVRLGIEFSFFGFAIWALYNMKSYQLGLVLGALVLVHYVISYDRILWLLKK